MRKKRKTTHVKLCFIFIILIISLAFTSISYSHWSDEVEIYGSATSTNWDPCIKIRKTLEKGCPNKCGDKFYLTIEVMNNGSEPNDLTNVEVTDSIGKKATPILETIIPNKGYVTWDTLESRKINTLTWTIGDLAVDETVTLSMCLYIKFGCCNYISAEVILPEDTNGASTHPVTRVTQGDGTETVYYEVEHRYNHRGIKFEGCEPEGLGEGGKVQTDTFVITVSKGCSSVLVTTKAGCSKTSNLLSGIGDTIVDENKFTITLEDIVDLGGDLKEYTITVTSDGRGGRCSPALSYIEFDFGKKCTIVVNEGATVTAESLWCDLEATTEGLNIYLLKFWQPACSTGHWVEIKIIDSSTPWAWDCCEPCSCEC